MWEISKKQAKLLLRMTSVQEANLMNPIIQQNGHFLATFFMIGERLACFLKSCEVQGIFILDLSMKSRYQSLILSAIIQYQYSMLPFQSNLSQYIAEQYLSTPYYQPYFVYPNQESCWNTFSYPDPTAPASSLAYFDHDVPRKTEQPTKTQTKPKRLREKPNQESSASCQSAEESSDDSPDFKSRQKYGRNISSNIFHQMLKVIRSEKPFEELLDRLIAIDDLEITKKQFHQILNKRLSKLNPYVSNAKMGSFLNGISRIKMPQSREMSRVEGQYLRVLRVLCRYYLANVHTLYVFNKLKLKRESKEYHIQEMRRILKVMIK